MFRWIYHAIQHEFGLKLLALTVATGLWLYVMNTEDPIRSEALDREITTINAPRALEVSKVRPEHVRLRLRGRLSSLEAGNLKQVHVIADLSEAALGRKIGRAHV